MCVCVYVEQEGFSRESLSRKGQGRSGSVAAPRPARRVYKSVLPTRTSSLFASPSETMCFALSFQICIVQGYTREERGLSNGNGSNNSKHKEKQARGRGGGREGGRKGLPLFPSPSLPFACTVYAYTSDARVLLPSLLTCLLASLRREGQRERVAVQTYTGVPRRHRKR